MRQILLLLFIFSLLNGKTQTLNFQPGAARMFYSEMTGFGFMGEICIPLKKKNDRYFISASLGAFYATQDLELSFEDISPANHSIISKDLSQQYLLNYREVRAGITFSNSMKTAKTSQSIVDVQINRNFQLNNKNQITFGLGFYYSNIFHQRFSHFIDIDYAGVNIMDVESGYAVSTSYFISLIYPKVDLRYTYFINPKFHLGIKTAYFHLDAPFYGLLLIAPNFVFRF